MSSKYVHICDNCGMQGDSIEVKNEYSFSYSPFYRLPKSWNVVASKDVCSKKCAKQIVDKLKELPEVPCCACCNSEKSCR